MVLFVTLHVVQGKEMIISDYRGSSLTVYKVKNGIGIRVQDLAHRIHSHILNAVRSQIELGVGVEIHYLNLLYVDRCQILATLHLDCNLSPAVSQKVVLRELIDILAVHMVTVNRNLDRLAYIESVTAAGQVVTPLLRGWRIGYSKHMPVGSNGRRYHRQLERIDAARYIGTQSVTAVIGHPYARCIHLTRGHPSLCIFLTVTAVQTRIDLGFPVKQQSHEGIIRG